MINDNLKLWNSVEKTNPKYTKKANVKGNNITSIAPQYQIMCATEHFGSYGKDWGLRDIKIDYTLVPVCGLIYWSAEFFYPLGKFPATNSISIWRDGAMTKADDQFAKKVETDALTKCLSKLGFNADIFMGKFDDVRYIQEMNQEFDEIATKLRRCTNEQDLANVFRSLNPDDQKKYANLTKMLKEKFNTKEITAEERKRTIDFINSVKNQKDLDYIKSQIDVEDKIFKPLLQLKEIELKK